MVLSKNQGLESIPQSENLNSVEEVFSFLLKSLRKFRQNSIDREDKEEIGTIRIKSKKTERKGVRGLIKVTFLMGLNQPFYIKLSDVRNWSNSSKKFQQDLGDFKEIFDYVTNQMLDSWIETQHGDIPIKFIKHSSEQLRVIVEGNVSPMFKITLKPETNFT